MHGKNWSDSLVMIHKLVPEKWKIPITVFAEFSTIWHYHLMNRYQLEFRHLNLVIVSFMEILEPTELEMTQIFE